MSIADRVDNPGTVQRTKRVNFGIDIQVGRFSFDEWGLKEPVAKMVDATLTKRGDKSFVIDGVTFSRRKPSELAEAIAAFAAADDEAAE